MAEKLLLNQEGEFYPFGSTITTNGEYKEVGFYEGDDFPISKTLINGLKQNFEKSIESGTIRSYAITFDCLAQKDENSVKTDAVAIQYYSIEDDLKATYYYPYQIAEEEVQFGEPWGRKGH